MLTYINAILLAFTLWLLILIIERGAYEPVKVFRILFGLFFVTHWKSYQVEAVVIDKYAGSHVILRAYFDGQSYSINVVHYGIYSNIGLGATTTAYVNYGYNSANYVKKKYLSLSPRIEGDTFE